jgi:hypothetical protein
MPTDNKQLQRPEKIALISAIGWFVASTVSLPLINLVAAGIGAFLGLRWLWRFLSVPTNLVHQLDLGSISLIAILNVGYLFSWLASTVGLDKEFSETFSTIGLTPAKYAVAVFYVMLFAAAMGALGRLPPLRRMETKLGEQLLRLREMKTGSTMALVAFCLFVDLGSIASGLLRFKEIDTGASEQGRIAWFLPFLQLVFTVQVFLNALLLVQSIRGRIKWFALGLALVSTAGVIFVYFNLGRGPMVLAMALHFIYYCLFRGKRPSAKILIPAALIGLLILPKALEINHLMRSSSTRSGLSSLGADPFSVASQGFDALKNEQTAKRESKDSLENYSTRPLVANTVARCIAMDGNVKQFMEGRNLFFAAVWAVPRKFFPGKVKYASPKGFLFRAFPDQAFLKDFADSLYLYSYVDFGWFGLLIYPAILALLWLAALFVMAFLRRPLFVWVIFCTWPPAFLLSVGEGAPTGWLIVLRDTIMFAAVLWIVDHFLPKFRTQRSKSRHPLIQV